MLREMLCELRKLSPWELVWGACQLMIVCTAIWLLVVGMAAMGSLSHAH